MFSMAGVTYFTSRPKSEPYCDNFDTTRYVRLWSSLTVMLINVLIVFYN